jgi:leucyl-tRNA synthetase
VIGFGTLSDLMRSKFWGKFPLFAWTNDKVKVSKKIIEPKAPKESKPYKKQTLLTPEDFDSLGIDKAKIGLFYNSLEGRKMSKSTGNFLTVKDCIDKFGVDATRMTLADAGDGLDDANFDTDVANATILKLYTFEKWIIENIKASIGDKKVDFKESKA